MLCRTCNKPYFNKSHMQNTHVIALPPNSIPFVPTRYVTFKKSIYLKAEESGVCFLCGYNGRLRSHLRKCHDMEPPVRGNENEAKKVNGKKEVRYKPSFQIRFKEDVKIKDGLEEYFYFRPMVYRNCSKDFNAETVGNAIESDVNGNAVKADMFNAGNFNGTHINETVPAKNLKKNLSPTKQTLVTDYFSPKNNKTEQLKKYETLENETKNLPNLSRSKLPEGICLHCGVLFNSKQQAKIHMKETHNTSVRVKSVSDYDIKFNISEVTEEIEEEVVDSLEDYKCRLCGMQLKSEGSVRRHLMLLHDVLVKDKECEREFFKTLTI